MHRPVMDRTMTLLNILKTRADGWWIVATTASGSSSSFCRCCVSCWSSSIHWKQDAESRPEVGSSRIKRLGLETSSDAMDSRFSWPPEQFATLTSAQMFSPNWSNNRWTIDSWSKWCFLAFFLLSRFLLPCRWIFLFKSVGTMSSEKMEAFEFSRWFLWVPSLPDVKDPGKFFNLDANISDSRTVKWDNIWSFWLMKLSFTSLHPVKVMSPETPVNRFAARHSKRVVFPHPDGPIMAVNSPDLKDPFNPFRMTDLVDPVKSFEIDTSDGFRAAAISAATASQPSFAFPSTM